jgi:hypothetical protein
MILPLLNRQALYGIKQLRVCECLQIHAEKKGGASLAPPFLGRSSRISLSMF